LIYRVGEALESDREVLFLKLWGGKQTLVHRRLWPPLVRIGRARTEWQLAGIGEVSLQLLASIEREHTIRSDLLSTGHLSGSRGSRAALRDLEDRLLVLTRSVHTSTGAHALEAESWVAWRARVRAPRFLGTVASAQLAIENAARRLTPSVDPRRRFPWGRLRTKMRSARP
jgi:hypothetical protein